MFAKIKKTISNFYQKHSKIVNILFILTIGLLSLTWFEKDLFISNGDFFLPQMTTENAIRSLSSWDHLYATGIVNMRILAASFLTLFLAVFQAIFSSEIIAEKIIFYGIFAGSGLSMYYLASSTFAEDKRKNIISLSTTFFYMFNFFALFSFWRVFIGLAFFYTIAPLMLCTYIKMLDRFQLKYLTLFLIIATVIFPIAVANPAYALVLFLILFLYFIYYIAINKNEKKKIKSAFFSSVIILVLFIVFNTWWILPIILNLSSEMESASATGGTLSVFQGSSLNTSILNLYRLFGPWSFYSNNTAGEPYFAWANIYGSSIFILLGFIAPLLASIFFLRKKKKIMYFFAILFLIGLFLMKGAHEPLKGLSEWIFSSVSFFSAFRNQYEKFGTIVAIGYSMIIGSSIGYGYDFIKKRSPKIAQIFVPSVLILMFGVYMWPYWTGDLIPDNYSKTPSAHVKIPDNYYEAQTWLKDQPEEFKIISLPHQEGASYDWRFGYGGSEDPAVQIFQRPILTPSVLVGKDGIYIQKLFNLFQMDSTADVGIKALGLTNVKYILVHNDLNYYFNTPYQLDSKDIKKVLSNQNEISFDKSFEEIDFYKINDDYLLPQIYASTNPIYVEGGLNEYLYYLKNNLKKPKQEKPSIILSKDGNDLKFENNPSLSAPQIVFNQISPTKYKVQVTGAKNSYLLNFLDSYNKNWKIYLVDSQKKQSIFSTWRNKPIADDKHYVVNNFANSWLIEPNDSKGKENYEIMIEFVPQRIFYIGMIISTIAIILYTLIVLTIFLFRKPKKINDKNI